jgi:Mrp family chromosome partitioning ATPase
MRTLLVLVLLVGSVTPISAEIGPPVDLATRARGADLVVVARVVDVASTFGASSFGDRIILSAVTVDVAETLKGVPQQAVTLTVEGGTVGDLTLRVSDMPALQTGDRAVLFLDADGRGGHIPHRRGLGILKVDAGNRVEGSSVTLDDVRQAVRGVQAQGRGGR